MQHLDELSQLTSQQRRELRYQKFRNIGMFEEALA